MLAQGVHAGFSWLVGLLGGTSALTDAFVSVSTVLVTVILVVAFVRFLVALFSWRCRAGIRMRRGRGATTRMHAHKPAEAA